MRLRHPSGRIVHLSHGTNLRPARDLRAVVDQLDTYASAVRARLGVGTLGVSLWLPPTLAAALAVNGRARTRLRAELDARGLEVVTLSGVPYAEGGGENPAGANPPDWGSPARLDYTLDLARILVDLLPDDAVRGAVTTIGLGRRQGWDTAKERSCARMLHRLSGGLAEVAWQTGRAVRVGFQPGPGLKMDTAAATIAALATVDRERLGVSLDLANLACAWQDAPDALDAYAAAGVSIIRVQIAAALGVPLPATAVPTLRRYADPARRHPVVNRDGTYVDDLPQAIAELPPGPWRLGYRVPLNKAPEPPLITTGDFSRGALHRLFARSVPATDYVDLDVPSWDCLPAGPDATVELIAAELAYAKRELASLGLDAPACALPR